MSKLMVADTQVEWNRKKIKYIYLRVLPPDGNVVVNAPFGVRENDIKNFVLSKIDWIHIQQEIVRKNCDTQNYDSGDEITLWGKRYILLCMETTSRPMIKVKDNNIILSLKSESTLLERKKLINSLYRKELTIVIPQLISKWEKIIQVKSEGYRLRDMKTRWGSCNIRTKIICLNLQLAAKDIRCLEYVVIHELVHLLERNHNSIFKGYMDLFLPEWRDIKRSMNRNLNTD